MRKGFFLFLIAALLLLAGCAEPAAEVTPTPSPLPSTSPLPTPDPEPTPRPTTQVTVHWDALESAQPKTALANRWYEDYTDDLIPSDEYGPLVPYIGGEVNIRWWGNGWYYGLATMDGTIVTDAVFQTATYDGYYDNQHYGTIYPDPMVLYLSKPSEEGRLIGLAAGDGSWYTGQVYTATLCESQYGSLMAEVSGDVVMMDWNGREVFRWPADSIPLPDYDPESFIWHNGGISDHWLRYDYEYDYTRLCYYVDLRSGKVQEGTPADWVEPTFSSEPGDIAFGGGWYKKAAGGADVRMIDGETFRYPLPQGYLIRTIDGDRVLISKDTMPNLCTLTDLEGNVLAENLTDSPQFVTNHSDTPSLLVRTTYGPSYWSNWQHVLDRDGQPLLTARDSSFEQFGDRLVFADDYYYRMTDLEGNDLIRIPRFSADH